MYSKETRDYLSQIIRLNRKIENKSAELEQLRRMAVNITPRVQKATVQTTPEIDKVGDAVVKIVDLEEKINHLVDELIDKRALVISQIDSIEDVRYYHILSKRYVAEKTFEEIAAEMSYNMRQVFRVHNKALEAFEKKYGQFYLK